MECKIIILLYAASLVYKGNSQMPNFDGTFPMPDYGVGYTTENYEEAEEQETFEFNPFETSAVLHNEPMTVRVKLGSDVMLPCQVTNPGSLAVYWSFLQNNKKLTDGDKVLASKRHYGVDVKQSGEWNLMVKDVRHEDAGEYVCMLLSVPPQMKSVYLEVKAPPQIEKSSLKEIYQVMEGEPIYITCEVAGSPIPVVQWYSYSIDPDTYQEEKRLFSNDSILQIQSLKRSEGGIYRCEASNNQGSDLYEIMIEAKYAPEPASSTTEILVKYGTAAKLECVYYSSPRAAIEWRKGGKKIRRNWKYSIDSYKEEKTQGSELTVRSTDLADNGKYKCIATNDIGRRETIFTVLVVETTTSTQSTPTSSTTTTTTTLSSTRPTTKTSPTAPTKSATSNITPGEIVNPTTEKIENTPRTGQSHSGAGGNASVKLVFIFLTMLLSLLLKVS